MYSVIFTQAARTELIEAQDWYEREAAGLGGLFRQAIDVLTERMSANPRQFPAVFKDRQSRRRNTFICSELLNGA